jgi:preprotein translocase subunit SecG
MLTQIIVILAILFLIALILAPIYYYIQRDKYAGSTGQETEEKGKE